MAKKTKKKATAKAGKGTARKRVRKAEESPPSEDIQEVVTEPVGEDVPKKAGPECAFCGKSMKDNRTRMIHERNCRAKTPLAEKPKADVDAEVLAIRDRFQDQVDEMARQMREREEMHQRELDEVKTVLRMEIDRHRKELDRLSKVEREVAQVEEQQAGALPEPKKDPVAPKPQAESPAPAEEPPRAQVRDKQPKAIDMVPLPAPTLPKRKPLPPAEDAIPDIDGDEAAQTAVAGLDREAVEALVRDIIAGNPPAAAAELPPGFVEKVDRLSSRMEHLDQKIDRSIAEVQRGLDRIGKTVELKRIEKDLEKVSDRVLDIMEDSGYGESLSVSKIPPTILEIVYQAIIDDVYIEIVKTKGYQDAEKIARSTLEEVRLKTSGSELFKFDGRKIVTDNLARSIEANLISAKQIQTTYDVLLERLLETVPHHKAKNFKGMIKVKSQEFAVDRATKLTKDFVRIQKDVDTAGNMLAALSSSFSARSLELHEALATLREKDLSSKADRDEVDLLRSKLDEANERCARLADELATIRAEAEMRAATPESEEQAPEGEEEAILTPGEEPFIESEDISQPGEVMQIIDEPAAETADEIAMQNEAILSAVGRGIETKRSLATETGLEDDLLELRIAELVERNKLIEKKVGKKLRYTTLEREMEKAREDEPEPAEEAAPKRKGKKAKKAEEPEPEPPVSEPEPVEEKPLEEPEPMPEPAEAPKAEEPAAEAEPEKTAPKKKGKKAKKEKVEEPEPDEPKPAKKGKKGKKARKENTEEPAPEPVPDMSAPEEPAKEAPEEEPVPSPEPEEKPAHQEKHKDRKREEQASEPEEEGHISNGLPVVKKGLDELSDDEREVLDAVTADGMTISGIQSKVGKHMKRLALLRALRVLVDSGHVGILTKGRMELYQRITVEKMDKNDKKENETEVK